MRLNPLPQSARSRVTRIARLAFAVGAVPLLATLHYRSIHVIDHLDATLACVGSVRHVRLGSGDGHLFANWSSSPHVAATQHLFTVLAWQDHGPFDCRNLVLFGDGRFATGGSADPGYLSAEIDVGYPGLLLVTGLSLLVWWRRRRNQRSTWPGGFGVVPSPAPLTAA